jgi:hypothetical protein
MYKIDQFDLPSPWEEAGVAPPYYLLAALPSYVTSEPIGNVFSIMDVLWEVFHDSKRTSTLIQPRIWAPAWGESELFSYLTDPLPKGFWPFVPTEPDALRARNFLEPEEVFPANVWAKDPCYDIVHFTGSVASPGRGRLWLDDGNKPWTPEELAKKLVACRTRLFVFQCARPEEWETGREFVEKLVQAGAGAGLAIAGSAEEVRSYCRRFYAGIAHNRPLTEATWIPGSPEPAPLSAYLALRKGGDESLLLDAWVAGPLVQQLGLYAEFASKEQDNWPNSQRTLVGSVADYVHPTQLGRLIDMDEKERDRAAELIQAVAEQMNVLQAIPPQPWHHESEGSLVVAGVTESMRKLRPQSLKLLNRSMDLARISLSQSIPGGEVPAEVLQRFESELRAAPRVLNAGFRAAGQAEMINETQSLTAGTEYELLVDVGPRWNKLHSLVTGSAEFPTQALPPNQDGYLVDVVFLSEVFTPSLVSGRIFLPRDSGRSIPWNQVEVGPKGRPLVLKVRAPESAADGNATAWVAHGRLGLYYENNLLQSAQVAMNISRDGMGFAPQPNKIEVDYVLSGGFQDVGDRFGKRKVRFAEDDNWEETEGKGYPVAMSITLNDDGGGSHRILVMRQETTQADAPLCSGWMLYDPEAAEKLLKGARENLLDCFFEKDMKTGEVDRSQNRISLDGNNGQKKDQFLWDLVRLAEYGDKLFDAVFSKLRLAGDIPTGAAQARLFQNALKQPRLIQVARTGTASHTFPWALLYGIPLSKDRSKNKRCKILEEWDSSGRRTNHAKACPYVDEPGHEKNTYCPYGFWGLQHIVEQPLSPLQPKEENEANEKNEAKDRRLREALSEFGTPGAIALGLCSTSALADMSSLESHLRALAMTKPYEVHLPAAEGIDAAEGELLEAALVYFLCHGKFDLAEDMPYIGIGPDDEDPQHRIYPQTIMGWARDSAWKAWEAQHPLVFINGCHTSDLTPGQVLEFVSAFGFAGASGVVGTEVNIQLPLAIEAARSLLTQIGSDISVGQALYRIRWDFVNKGNLLGLAYTPYCLANLAHASGSAPAAG